jgi:hypothetical protein
MTTYVWIYSSRDGGRPIGLRLCPYDDLPDNIYILSARFAVPAQAAAALSYYLDYTVDGYAIVNDRHAGQPVDWPHQIHTALHIAPWLVGLQIVSFLVSCGTFLVLITHLIK